MNKKLFKRAFNELRKDEKQWTLYQAKHRLRREMEEFPEAEFDQLYEQIKSQDEGVEWSFNLPQGVSYYEKI